MVQSFVVAIFALGLFIPAPLLAEKPSPSGEQSAQVVSSDAPCPAHAQTDAQSAVQDAPGCCGVPSDVQNPVDPVGARFKALPLETQNTAREVCQQYYENLSQLLQDAWSKRMQLNAILAKENAAESEIEKAQKEFDMAHSRLVQTEQDFKITLKEKTGLTPADCATPACGPTR